MDPKDVEFFRDLLTNMLQDILKKGEETIEDMTDTVEVYADRRTGPRPNPIGPSPCGFGTGSASSSKKSRKPWNASRTAPTASAWNAGGHQRGPPQGPPVTTLCIKCKSKQEAEENLRGE